jgi:hypothetical protein
MLDACRRKAEAAGVTPGIYQQFLQDLDLPRTYRFVFCPAGSFQLIPRDEQLPALRAIARHMERGGELVVEMGFPGESPTGPSPQDAERRITRQDGAEIVITWEESGMMRYDLVRDGEIVETEFETFVLHPAPRAVFEAMLAEAGFADIRGLWPYKDEIARPNAPFALFVCTKS